MPAVTQQIWKALGGGDIVTPRSRRSARREVASYGRVGYTGAQRNAGELAVASAVVAAPAGSMREKSSALNMFAGRCQRARQRGTAICPSQYNLLLHRRS